MTLTLTPIMHDDLCHGLRWTVQDIDALAEQVAGVALGQYRHVAKILEDLNIQPKITTAQHAANAIQKLQVAKDGSPWHRDGWIFQVISWIAANLQEKGAILQPPHAYHAHKGFDGVQLKLSSDKKSVSAIVIFEDKATTNERSKIKQEVLPDIIDLESGGRVAELTSEATALLEAQQHAFANLDIDEAIDKILWQEVRNYRIAITIDDSLESDANRKKLFKDYDLAAPGLVDRRQAETMHFNDLRQWMADFSSLVTQKIIALVPDV